MAGMAFILLLVFVAMCCCCSVVNSKLRRLSSPNSLPDMEMQALYDLYASTDGSNWNCCVENGIRWDVTNTSSNPCTDDWQGIQCIVLSDQYHVQEVVLPYTNLVGTVPQSVENLSFVTKLGLDKNLISGSIPPTMGNLSLLEILALEDNSITGSVPSSFSKLSNLTLVDLVENNLDGTLPSVFGLLSNLEYLRLTSNHFDGTIPNSYYQLSRLKQLYVANNDLVGSLSSDISNLLELEDLVLTLNFITGSIPSSIVSLSKMVYCYLQGNSLTGQIPAVVGLAKVTVLYLGDNMITGPLPDLSPLKSLKQLLAYDNLLTGTIPNSEQIPILNTLELSYNLFTGTLDNVFDSSRQLNLSSIEVQNNQLTGSLPDELFALPGIKTVSAMVNCFHGELPSSVCSSPALSTLILDGMSSASSCRIMLLGESYITKHSVGGTIPDCLFQQPSLVTLHLAGNGFDGSLPGGHIVVGLADVTVSHNFLTGPIGENIQERIFGNLDLSFNRLSGELSSSFASQYVANFQNFSLALDNNRLSGHIPGSLIDLEVISILGTNLFSCNFDESDLPKHDENRNNYECGSNSFEVQLYFLALVAFLVFGTILFFYCIRRTLKKYVDISEVRELVKVWLLYTDPNGPGGPRRSMSNNTDYPTGPSGVNLLRGRKLQKSMSIVQRISVGTMASAHPNYVALNSLQMVGLIFRTMRNIIVTAAIFGLFFLTPMYTVLRQFYSTYSQTYMFYISATYMAGIVPFLCELIGWFFILSCVIAVLFMGRRRERFIKMEKRKTYVIDKLTLTSWQLNSVYALYVLVNIIIVGGVNAGYVIVVMNASRGWIMVYQLFLSVFKLFWNRACSVPLLWFCVSLFSPENAKKSRWEARLLDVQLYVAMMNYVIIPVLLVAFISADCFHYVLEAPPDIDSTYKDNSCLPTALGCKNVEVIDSNSFVPPFSYNYQCSSSIITYYAPAYVNICLLRAVVLPILKIFAVQLQGQLKSDCCLFKLIDVLLPKMLKYIPMGNCKVENGTCYFNVNQVLILIKSDLVLLLTFGVMFPPLELTLAIATASLVIWTRLEVGRFIENVPHKAAMIKALHEDCDLVQPKLVRFGWVVLFVCSFFYTLFFFDTLGGTMGFNGALWVLFVIPVLPLLIYAIFKIIERLYFNDNVDHENKDDNVEMVNAKNSALLERQSSHIDDWDPVEITEVKRMSSKVWELDTDSIITNPLAACNSNDDEELTPHICDVKEI